MNALKPLGDQALLASFADESSALRFASWLRTHNPLWLLDVVQAYSSVAVFFLPERINHNEVREELIARQQPAESVPLPGRFHRIPCCYEMQLDLEKIAAHTRRSGEEVIQLHFSTVYTVYAIGFCPGFPYLGYLPSELSGVPRLSSPRLRVEAGSIGLTGRQTGIYTESRPGGWNIVGRTPLELVNVREGYFPLRTGDRVQFFPIDEKEYCRLLGQRL